MEKNYQSLQDQISQANNYYQDLCDTQDELLQACKKAMPELTQVEDALNSMYESIASGTKMSHIGASQAISVLQSTIDRLNKVYRLLKLDRTFTISASGVKATSRMIHYSPGIAAKRKKLAEYSQKITDLGGKTRLHAESLDTQKSDDTTLYQDKASHSGGNIQQLGKAINEFAKIIAEAERRYGEAQVNAIIRANNIPH